MEERKLSDKIEMLKGVGTRRAALYAKLGVTTIHSLLTLYPRDYLDLTAPVPILETVLGENNVIRATVVKKQGEQFIRKGLSLFKVFVSDHSETLTITIFNSRFLFDALQLEQEYCFYGKVTGTLLRREMASPLFVQGEEPALIRPIYSLTEGLTNKMIQTNVQDALAVWGDRLTDSLPTELRQEQNLCQLRYAIENIHFPTDNKALEIARKRLIFEELLVLQLGMLLLRKKQRVRTGIRLARTDIGEFYESLPFTLTEGQCNAVADGLRDMSGGKVVPLDDSPETTPPVSHGTILAESSTGTTAPMDSKAILNESSMETTVPVNGKAISAESSLDITVPMNRLVQGDVGSGKTMVAAALCYACYKNGYQSAVMAPTQILAEQHYSTMEKQLSPLGVRCCLLTGGQTAKQRQELLNGVASGEYAVVIGTHALVQSEVKFHALGLVVTDEQHRFGVAQRAALSGKGENPHLLVMSATPIPRTLALIIYGDLDVSVIRELPKGRQPIDTFAVDSNKRGRALGFVKKQVEEGRQAYIVCPLIDDNESDLISTSNYLETLKQTPLSAYRMEALHGKLKPKEKEALMGAFKAGEIQILVSTTVVEVGVDVPNANIMMIENAERFGLSQLHQLRGRVGRGQYKSYCILVSDNQGEDNKRRLQVMTSTADGFRIAEEDLKLRGPGDFFGLRQHGLPDLKIANLLEDMDTLNEARDSAIALLKADPSLKAEEHRSLRAEVKRLFSQNEQVTLN